MVDFLDNYDDIVFLDSELEDDDDSAPVGELIEVVDGKVRIAHREEPAPEEYAAPVAEEAAEKPAEAIEEPTKTEEPVETETPAPAEEEKSETELPKPDPVYLYAYGITPSDAEKTAAEETAETPAPAEEEAPSPVEEAPAEPEPEPVSAPVEAEENAAQEIPVKTAPARKPKSELIIQAAADDSNVWGAAVIKPAKKTKPVPAADAEADNKTTPAASADKGDRNKEETAVAKEKAKEAKDTKKTAANAGPAKKEAVKKAPAKAQEKAPAKAPAKTEPAKKTADKKAPSKAAAKAEPVKKEATKKTEAGEQVLEAGDDSAPHGKFVIKKTDKGNFVYKLYSSNYRVVAIGAGLYSSIASAKVGINSVRNNAASAHIEDQTLQKWEELKFPKWQIYTDKQGEIRLRLFASNGEIVATTNDGYLSKDAAKKGIAAIARAAKGSSIVRNDDLW